MSPRLRRAPISENPPRWARPFVYLLLALLFSCVALNIESWPLTSFRLFDQVRGPQQLIWEIVTVDYAGVEHTVNWSSLPAGFKGWSATARQFVQMDPGVRERILRSWGKGVLATGKEVVMVRVYQLVRDTPTELHTQPRVVSRALQYQVYEGVR